MAHHVKRTEGARSCLKLKQPTHPDGLVRLRSLTASSEGWMDAGRAQPCERALHCMALHGVVWPPQAGMHASMRGSSAGQYVTDVVRDKALAQLRAAAASGQPFFMQVRAAGTHARTHACRCAPVHTRAGVNPNPTEPNQHCAQLSEWLTSDLGVLLLSSACTQVAPPAPHHSIHYE